MVSANYMQEAVDRGWYDPAAGKPFIWQDIYAPLPVRSSPPAVSGCSTAPSCPTWPSGPTASSGPNPYGHHQPLLPVRRAPLPLSVLGRSRKKRSRLQDVIAFQRSVFEGTIYDFTAQPQWLVPDGKGGYQGEPAGHALSRTATCAPCSS